MIKKLINIRTQSPRASPSFFHRARNPKWKIRIRRIRIGSIHARRPLITAGKTRRDSRKNIYVYIYIYSLPFCYLRRPFDNLINSAGTKPCRVLDRIARWSNWHSIRIESGVYTGFDPDPWIRQHAKRSGDASITSISLALFLSLPDPPLSVSSRDFSHPFDAIRGDDSREFFEMPRVWEIVSLIESNIGRFNRFED